MSKALLKLNPDVEQGLNGLKLGISHEPVMRLDEGVRTGVSAPAPTAKPTLAFNK